MTSPQVPNLHHHYQTYYDGGPRELEWRRLGAISKANNVVSLAGSLGCRRILEVGCGDGAVLARLADLRFADEYAGVDISASGVEILRQRGIAGLGRAEQIQDHHLPFRDREFDLVIMSHVIEHLPNPRLAIAEAGRVGRNVFVEVPLEYRVLHFPEHFTWTETGHINFYSRRLIRQLLESCNLRLLSELTTNPNRGVFQHQRGAVVGAAQWCVREAALRLLPRLASSVFAYHYAGLFESGSA